MEAAELTSYHQEHSKRLLWVLSWWEKGRVQAERERDLGRLVKVRLKDVSVESRERLKDHKLVLVRSGLANLL